jgi:hypothetical protein
MKYQILRTVGAKGWAGEFSVREDLNNHVQLGWKGAGVPAGSTIALYTYKKDEKGICHKAEQVAVLEQVKSDHSSTQKGTEVPAEWTALLGQKALIMEVVEIGMGVETELPIA